MPRKSSLLMLAITAAFMNVTTVADPLLDQDHDGVVDTIDKCPNTPLMKKPKVPAKYAALFSQEELSDSPHSVPVDQYGCTLDSDNDGVADYLDYCPDNTALEISKGVSHNGCSLHSDADGTPDYRDKCPNTEKGVATDRYGCPK